ncbi:MAG: hypothetical protein GX856_08945 [Gammaproteobacteria bacterium]|jgi:hypothetical protein|nr:hypothetical protein [Gammaproteobacteria bacterium]
MAWLRLAMAALVAASLGACVSMPAPMYQPSVGSSQALLASAGTSIEVGGFSAAHGVENTALGVRGSRLEPGSDGTYAGYLRDALATELKAAGRDGEVVYDRTLRVDHEWDSSFLGAIAIPTAFDNYAAAVQKLLQALFTDPGFVAATAPRPG